MIHAATASQAQSRPAAAPGVAAPSEGAGGTAITEAYVAGLRARAEELRDQRQTAVNLKSNVASQLRNASAAEAPGLQGRIKLLDDRILLLEQQITDNGKELASMPGELLASTSHSPPPSNEPSAGQITAFSIVFTVVVLMPLSIAFARMLWRRATHASRPLPPASEVTDRLERMERGIEAIAIEVERISEGQRFVVNLVGESAQRALGPGERPAEPIKMRVPEAARVRD